MRVLILQPNLLSYGGAAAAVAHLSAYLNSKDIPNSIVTLLVTKNFLNATEDLNLDIRSKIIVNSLDYISKHESLYMRFSRFFSDVLVQNRFISNSQKNYDLVNAHNFPANWSVLHTKPVVWMMNEPLGIYNTPGFLPSPIIYASKVFDRFLIRRNVDKICVNSQIASNQAKAIYGQEPEIVYFGIDYKRYSRGSPDEAKQKFGLDNRFVVITSGVLDPWKNQLESIRAIEKVLIRIPNILLVLAGGGSSDYISELRNYVKARNLDQYVLFTGFLSPQEIINLYHASSVGLYPFKEQGGLLAPFENICAGKPIIISTSNGASELVERFSLGVVTENYADAIIEIYENYQKYLDSAKKAKLIVKEEFSWDRYSERLLKVFENIYNNIDNTKPN